MLATAHLGTAANDPLLRDWSIKARRLTVAGCGAIAFAVIAMVVWAVFAPLSGSIVASGLVKVDTHRKTVQHRDGGMVREILVLEGDHVTAGQPLIVLSDARIDASFDLVGSQLDAHRIRLARLAAQQALVATWQAPEVLRARLKEPRIAEVLAREQAVFGARRSALHAQIRLVERQLAEVAVELAAREREYGVAKTAMASMQEEVELNEALAGQQFVSRTRVMGLKRNVAEYQYRIEDNRAELAKARQNEAELQLRLAGLRETYVQDATTELRDTNAKIVDLEEQLRAARDASQRQIVSAPVSGRVVDLRATTPGGSIGPRDPILDIVPDGSRLLIVARVGVDAIGELHAGLPTDVRLTAYKQRDTPLVEGKVVYVSADSLTDPQTQAPYYLVHVEVDAAALEKAGGGVELKPGMGAEVFVRTHERTAMEYLLEPFVNATRRAFREH